ncbi:MAG: response regulator, partial [Terracoccus sp.]
MRVLVVEDERNLAETLRRGLTDEGFVVEVVHDGVEALWMATENPFDAIVLDIMLPQLNGYKVLERLRERQVWS